MGAWRLARGKGPTVLGQTSANSSLSEFIQVEIRGLQELMLTVVRGYDVDKE